MDLVNTVLSIPSVQTLIGALIAFVISRIFYQRAAEDLKRTAQDLGAQNKQLQQQNENLKRMNGVTLRFWRYPGCCQTTWWSRKTRTVSLPEGSPTKRSCSHNRV